MFSIIIDQDINIDGPGVQDTNGALMKILMQVTWGSIRMIITFDSVLIDKWGIFQVNVGQKLLKFVGREKMNIKIPG